MGSPWRVGWSWSTVCHRGEGDRRLKPAVVVRGKQVTSSNIKELWHTFCTLWPEGFVGGLNQWFPTEGVTGVIGASWRVGMHLLIVTRGQDSGWDHNIQKERFGVPRAARESHGRCVVCNSKHRTSQEEHEDCAGKRRTCFLPPSGVLQPGMGQLKLSIFISTDAITTHAVPLRLCLNRNARSGISQAMGLSPSEATWAVLIMPADFHAVRARGEWWWLGELRF